MGILDNKPLDELPVIGTFPLPRPPPTNPFRAKRPTTPSIISGMNAPIPTPKLEVALPKLPCDASLAANVKAATPSILLKLVTEDCKPSNTFFSFFSNLVSAE